VRLSFVIWLLYSSGRMKYLLGLIRNVVVKITHDEDFAIRCKDFIFSFMKRKTVYFEGKNISF
jgi:hypothetical protein